jgi:hypothetical protein
MYSHFDDDDLLADYMQLLRIGSVTRMLHRDAHTRWRSALHARAREDSLRLRTSSVRLAQPNWVYAKLPDRPFTIDELAAVIARRLVDLPE